MCQKTSRATALLIFIFVGVIAHQAVGFPDKTADPQLEDQWWYQKLRLEDAWMYASGAGVRIADCDSGFYIKEPDIYPNLELDLRFDFGDRDNPQQVDDGSFPFHGTAVAAIIAGVKDGVGTNGIAYNASLVPLQHFNYDARLDDIDKETATVQCIDYSVNLGSINILTIQSESIYGSAEYSARVRDAIRRAIDTGITVVVAAGNSALELVAEREDDTGSIIVGAVRQDGSAANYSNFGDRVNVSAYGEGLFTLFGPNGRMDSLAGTTAATAQVAALVALLIETNPALSPSDVRTILSSTSKKKQSNGHVGGVVDFLAAIKSAMAKGVKTRN